MADYKAGNLTLELFGIDRSAEKTITNVVNKLNLLQRSLNVFQKVNATAVGKNLSSAFYNISRALGSINENDINKLSSLAKATNYLQRFLTVVQKSDSRQVYGKLNSLFRALSSSVNSIDQTTLSNIITVSSALSSLGRFSTKMTKLDFSKTETGFKNLAVAIQPFLEKVKEAEAGLSSLYGILQKSSGKKIQGLLGGGEIENKKGGFLGFAKLGVNIYMMRRLGRFMANLVQAGSDYNETLNLWQVAMRNNLDTADQFVNKMQKAYGISTKTLMNAQAIFKNMIGSLGQISDQTAYALSEALVQMSADFASLYNVTIESAFQKMQAMLAGQVRPIRSAGLDMTETTLFMFYQQLGGTKTMRQLNRTEKQLLSILAVYQQMGSAGALGDMTKTLNQFANQSRMMTEYWSELKTWSGLLLKDLVDQSGMLIYINALLITTTEIIKAIAKSRGLGEENFIDGMFEATEATNDEIDELQGKLLDFDKFRSLEGASASPLAIDEKLLEALTGYSSKIDQAENKAKQLAETWLKFWINEETSGLTEDAERVLSVMEGLVKVLGILLSIKVSAWLGHFVKGLFALKIAGQSVSTLGISVIIFALIEFVDAIRNGDDALATAMLMLAGTATVFVLLNSKIAPAIKSLKNFNEALVFLGAIILITGIAQFIHAWDDMSGMQRAVGIIAAVTGAVAGLVVALKLFKMNWAGAIGVAAMVAGTALAVTSSIKIPNYEMGASDIDSGTVFRAGEFGKTEAVYTGSNGKTNVANVRQMEQAFYNALSRHSREGNGTIVVQTYLDGEKVYENTTSKAKARGNVWAKV